MNSISPLNIAKKVGFIRLQSEFIKQWRNEIRVQRQIDIKSSPEIASVYRSDANDLLSIATALNKNIKIEIAQKKIRSLDTNVRQLVPDNIYNLVFT